MTTSTMSKKAAAALLAILLGQSLFAHALAGPLQPADKIRIVNEERVKTKLSPSQKDAALTSSALHARKSAQRLPSIRPDNGRRQSRYFELQVTTQRSGGGSARDQVLPK